ncbi:TPA: restriction endonuclease subunit S, partial [Klebsiella pneumoniae]|nr:restriction endonuclease subunit S [Klebsiella pneumoniae]HBV5488070.1 restriction endonuclease subunit S [Klebsiella pneumoniae]HBV5494264.1 restriction endonuclease subunit S [Klebsiella pneumoniae]HBV5558649.1 restriction endonuclease subunit S [Klebsiella pneumoniae]HBV6668841.1 restriction endonuclease subunit S [Klebsiella pneumoniae]
MSELSYLEKLLDGAEVEWKTLGSIAELKRGTSITKKDVIDGTIPVVAGGRTPAYYHN